jgi:hypothetical protein
VGPHRYRIIVSGRLGEFSRGVFEDLCVESDGANTGLSGELDQAGLYGVLDRILSLGLELVAVSRLDDGSSPPPSARLILADATAPPEPGSPPPGAGTASP